jgi:hypothetical protein
MTEYLCPTCGAPTEEPGILKALRDGFDAAQHCVIKGARGRVVKCVNWLNYRFCETCPVGGGLKKVRTAKA